MPLPGGGLTPPDGGGGGGGGGGAVTYFVTTHAPAVCLTVQGSTNMHEVGDCDCNRLGHYCRVCKPTAPHAAADRLGAESATDDGSARVYLCQLSAWPASCRACLQSYPLFPPESWIPGRSAVVEGTA